MPNIPKIMSLSFQDGNIRNIQARLALLQNLAEMVENAGDLASALDAALKLMASHLGMMRGAITLISPKTGKLRIESSFGLNPAQRKRGAYLPGEGVVGRVIASGQPMLVADVSKEPLFLNRTRSRDLERERIAFLCVPIKLAGKVVGALSVDSLSHDGAALKEDLRLLRVIAALLAHAACESRERMDDGEVMAPAGFVGGSACMRQVYEQIAIVGPSQATALLLGESGSGKELAARAIHAQSSRSHGPFISLNCAALPENLLESELFGHERGAFTGASHMRRGRFEQASGGSLFLDEIGELSPAAQAKLLRALQEKSFERLGGMETIRCDTRVIAATNRDLSAMTDAGDFRRDLFYRLNVFPIRLPPLRERLEDIPALCAHFLARLGHGGASVSIQAMDLLQKHDWPGNIRELRNALERAALLLGRDRIILPEHLPEALRGQEKIMRAAPKAGARLPERLAELERSELVKALRASGGRIGRAAVSLGMTQRILGLRLKKYGLDYRDFRQGKISAEQAG